MHSLKGIIYEDKMQSENKGLLYVWNFFYINLMVTTRQKSRAQTCNNKKNHRKPPN